MYFLALWECRFRTTVRVAASDAIIHFVALWECWFSIDVFYLWHCESAILLPKHENYALSCQELQDHINKLEGKLKVQKVKKTEKNEATEKKAPDSKLKEEDQPKKDEKKMDVEKKIWDVWERLQSEGWFSK